MTTSLRNANPNEGRHRDKPHILAVLKAATAPLPTRTLVQQVLEAAGEPPPYEEEPMAWQRVTNCLTYLLNEEIVVVSDVPIDHYRQRFWALADR